MKQLLTLLLFVFGTAAFANNNKDVAPPTSPVENNVCTKKEGAKTAKAHEAVVKNAVQKDVQQKEKVQKRNTTKPCNSVEGSSLGLSGYFVDFIHDSNVKLVKLFI